MKQITSKQRAFLRGMANPIEPILQIGKNGITPELCEAVNEALEKRELIKLHVLKNNLEDINQQAILLSERTRSLLVQVVGRKITLYRESKEHKSIEL